MASALPAKLKSADVQRFAIRAAQLQKFRPIVSYWCEYYILQQVLSRDLHTVDEECSNYAVTLMDKLESFKQENATNDAIVDDVAAKAYMENFALETFSRADEAQRSDKVTKQTADTFQAAATFLDLLTIWGEAEPEAAAKSKFAKYHALRIARAIKAGEDPNETNPVVEAPASVPVDDENVDAELKQLERQAAGGYQPPSVESAVDATEQPPTPTTFPASIGAETLIQPSDTPTGAVPPNTDEPGVSSVSPAEHEAERQGSVGGGYFPQVPPAASVADIHTPQLQPPFSPSTFYNAPPSAPTPGSIGAPHVEGSEPVRPTPSIANAYRTPVTPAAAIIPPPPIAPNPQPVPTGQYRTDDESVLEAQKHAKWAISALNFEDVNTAVKELRIALRSLGAS